MPRALHHVCCATSLVLLCAPSARAEPGAVAPLPAAQQKIFMGSAEDVLDKKPCPGFRKRIMMHCRDDRHYVRMNEWHHHVWRPYVAGIGGGYVGIASDQNLTFVAWAKSELVWLLDYDPVVVWIQHVHRAFFRAAPTSAELLALWDSKGVRKARLLLTAEYKTHPELKQILNAYRFYRAEIGGTFQQILKLKRRRAHWLHSEADYRYLHQLYRADRVRVLKGDLLKDKTVSGIGKAARQLGVKVRIVYLSNAEEFWGPYPQTTRQSMNALPMDEKSVVLRTRHTDKYGPRIGSYVYVVQGGLDFQKRLADPKTKRVYSMMEQRRAGRPGFFTIGIPVHPDSKAPGTPRRRRKPSAEAE